MRTTAAVALGIVGGLTLLAVGCSAPQAADESTAAVTDDASYTARVRLLRNYGMRDRHEIETAGVNSRLAEIQAAALRVQLPRLEEWNRRRARLAAIYRESLGALPELLLPAPAADADPAWHLFVVGHPDRDAAAAALAAAGISTLVHYPHLPHLTPPYRDEWAPGRFPVAERLSARALSLPLHPQLAPADAERVATALRATLEAPASS